MDQNKVFYRSNIADIFKEFQSSEDGLDKERIKALREEFGYNELRKEKKRSFLQLFFQQFINPLIFILLFASIVKFTVASVVDGSVILAIIFVMVIVAFFQEAKAEKAMEALKNLQLPKAKVKRAGRVISIPSKELVPGDILVLTAGDRVSADGRIISSTDLKINEATLTGESLPVEKSEDKIDEEVGLADQKNICFAGTTIVAGKGEAIIYAIGMFTEIGKIAQQMSRGPKEKTPLQKSIAKLSHWMLLIILSLVALFFVIGLFYGEKFIDLILLGVAIAVAAIPEGLPAVITVVLASGVHLMSKKNAIVRKLVAVETLGCTNVICSDKTGTLTQNKMEVTEIYTLQDHWKKENENKMHDQVRFCLSAAILCNDAHLHNGNDEILGDPTETCILQVGSKNGLKKEDLESENKRIDEIPFSSEKQFMATLHETRENNRLYVKGSFEALKEKITKIDKGSGSQELENHTIESLAKQMEQMAERGLRVLTIAYADKVPSPIPKDIPEELTFIGLIGMMDPPREDVIRAVEKCKRAGIEIKMITGDNAKTAKAIAQQIGIPADLVCTGQEIEHASDNDLEDILETTCVFARIQPLHKLKIVESIKKKKKIVAMTGDGVNDAPALEAADIGISMGITGTEVTKEASDMILSDDNFSTIVDSVEEGRTIFNRLRHAAAFLLTTCFGEVFTIFLAFILLKTSPLEPLQILWINLITGSLIAIPLGMEPKVGDELSYPPRNQKVGLLFPGMLIRVAFFSLLLGLGAFTIFRYYFETHNLEKAQTMVFCSIVLYEWFMAVQMRSDELQIWKIGLLKNTKLNIAGLISNGLFFGILYIPIFQYVFHTYSLNLIDWLICFTPGIGIFMIEAIRKQIAPYLFSFGKWEPMKLVKATTNHSQKQATYDKEK